MNPALMVDLYRFGTGPLHDAQVFRQWNHQRSQIGRSWSDLNTDDRAASFKYSIWWSQ